MIPDPNTPTFPDCPAPFNMAAHVLAAAQTQPDKPALCVVGTDIKTTTWSYGALEAAALGIGQGLLRAGLTPGDRLLLRLGNTVDFPLAYLGAIAVGILPVPTSPQLTLSEITKLSDMLGPQAMAVGPDIAAPEIDIPSFTPSDLQGFRSLPPAPYDLGDPNRPAYIVFTSGTSGTARGVIHAHRAVWARGMMTKGWTGLEATDRLLHAGAFNWTYTMGTGVIDPLVAGATSLIPAPDQTSEQLLTLLARHQATIFAAAPGIYRRLLRTPERFAGLSLRHGLSAGEKLPEALRRTWRQVSGCEIYEAYGMSECSTFISGAPDTPAKPGALGCVQPGRRVRLAGDTGTSGEITVHHSEPGLMLGYLEGGLPLTDGWFHTGDLAEQDADGQLFYKGRTDDMMNAGGVRVSPLEVEQAFETLPGLQACAAVTTEVKADTEVIALFYEARAPLPEALLQAHAKAHLAHYKTPRVFVWQTALPRSANGKINRRALRGSFPQP